jgi:hypothetical protein
MCRVQLGDGEPVKIKTARQKSELLKRAIEAAQAGKMVNFRRHDKDDDLYFLWLTEPVRDPLG